MEEYRNRVIRLHAINPRILVNLLVILVKILVNLLVKPTKYYMSAKNFWSSFNDSLVSSRSAIKLARSTPTDLARPGGCCFDHSGQGSDLVPPLPLALLRHLIWPSLPLLLHQRYLFQWFRSFALAIQQFHNFVGRKNPSLTDHQRGRQTEHRSRWAS